MPPHPADEVIGCEPSESGFMKAGIRANEIFRSGENVCEVASAASGDSDFLPGRVVTLEHRHRPPARSRLNCAHQPRRAGSDDDDVVGHERSYPGLPERNSHKKAQKAQNQLARRSASPRGRVIVKVVPCPGPLLSARMSPPCRFTM